MHTYRANPPPNQINNVENVECGPCGHCQDLQKVLEHVTHIQQASVAGILKNGHHIKEMTTITKTGEIYSGPVA